MMHSTSKKERKAGIKAEAFSKRLSESEFDELAEIVGRELRTEVQTAASMGRLVLLTVNCTYSRTMPKGKKIKSGAQG